jgi:SPOR domain
MTPDSGGSNDMAGNPIRSQHANGPQARDSTPGGANDPLAELARLIGQTDPFADFGRGAIRVGRPGDRATGQRVEPRFEAADAEAYHTGEDEHRQDQEGYAAYDGDEAAIQREEIYDDPPRAQRRGGTITIIAVAGLAVLGTAGAFGYRTISGPSAPATAPPVIKADTTPSKIVPSVNEQQSNKLIQDRVGGSQGERMVSREEQPVEVRPARSVFPPVGAPGSTASVSASPWPAPPAAMPPTAQASAATNEPRKVRTIPIRPDGSDASAQPATAPGRSASAASNTPDPAPARSAATGRPAGSGPLSLNPQNDVPEPHPAQRSPRVASAPNPPAPSAAIANGSYVQVSSQRSETDAQASFKALQGKYPAVLGGKQVVIRRAELGDKGVYYRAMVGPFASVEQAAELCTSLKAAGGQCIVQRN